MIASISTLSPLRQALASLEPHSGFPLGAEEGALPLGLSAVDALLAGGLALRALHEIAPAAPAHLGAAFGFALAVAAQAVRHATKAAHAPYALWIETDYTALEGGQPYGIGVDLFGLSM